MRLRNVVDGLARLLHGIGNRDGNLCLRRFIVTKTSSGFGSVLLPLVESLWLQVGPFMRVVFGRVGADGLVADRHAEAIEALETRDPEGARRAVAADLSEGMDKMRVAVDAAS